MPNGGRIELVEGGAVILDEFGALILAVQAPWAKDANGAAVPTHFETNGLTLTQVVDHASGPYAYPVIADPNLFNRVLNMLLGCVGLRDLARMGLAKAIQQGGKKVIARFIPGIGWVSCGIGAYNGWDS